MIQRPDILQAEEAAVADKQITFHIRLRLWKMRQIIGSQLFAKCLDSVTADVQPGGQHVPAKAFQLIGAGSQRSVDIETPAAAARALPFFPIQRDHH